MLGPQTFDDFFTITDSQWLYLSPNLVFWFKKATPVPFQSMTKNHQKKIYDPASFPNKIHNLHRRHAIFSPLNSFERQLSKTTLISPVAFLFRLKNPKNPSVPHQKPHFPQPLPQINSKPLNHIYIRDPHQISYLQTPKNRKSMTKNVSPFETLTSQPPYLPMQATSPL